MDMHFAQAPVELDRACFVHIVNAKGTTVTCLTGELWITRDGSPQDLCLPAGQVYRVPVDAHFMVNAFTPSKALVTRPAMDGIVSRRGSLARLLAALRGSLRTPERLAASESGCFGRSCA